MTPSLLGNLAATGGVANSGTVAVTAAAPGGALVVVRVTATGANAFFGGSITDARSNTWTKVVTNSNTNGTCDMYASSLTTALQSGDLLTFHSVAANLTVTIDAFSGLTSTASTHSYASAIANGATVTSGSVTAGDLAIGEIEGSGGAGAFTEPSSPWHALTQNYTTAAATGGSYLVPTATGTTTYTPTNNSASNVEIAIVAFPAAPVTVPRLLNQRRPKTAARRPQRGRF